MNWTDTFEHYLYAMTWGTGYSGQTYWREEEQWLRDQFGEAGIRRALSVGCGLFRELDALRGIASEEVTGLEYRQDFVDYVVAHLPADPLGPRLRVLQGDAMAMPVPAEYFDLVCVLFHTLTIFPDMDVALRQCMRAVSPGGSLVVSVWKDSSEVIAFRRRMYTSMGDKQSTVEYNPRTHTDDIVMSRNDKEVYRTPIVSEAYMRKVIQDALGMQPQMHELELARIFVMKKD